MKTCQDCEEALRVVVQDFNFFCRENSWTEILYCVISASRLASSAKLAIFFFCKKSKISLIWNINQTSLRNFESKVKQNIKQSLFCLFFWGQGTVHLYGYLTQDAGIIQFECEDWKLIVNKEYPPQPKSRVICGLYFIEKKI